MLLPQVCTHCRFNRLPKACTRLRDGVAAVDAQLRAGHVARSVGEEEGDSAHEVLGLAHLALRDEGDPLLGELGVVVEDLFGAIMRDTRLAAGNGQDVG
jgi:hypothetical protein